MKKARQDNRCPKCGAELTTQRFAFGFSVACPKEKCRGNGDNLLYHLTPEAAEKAHREKEAPKN